MKVHLGNFKHSPRWRLQTYLLQDEAFFKHLEKCIDEYFKLNTTETTASIRWEAFKAYIWGGNYELYKFNKESNKIKNNKH